MTLVTTVGSASANSYNSLTQLDAYAETTEWASDWDATDDDAKEILAMRAARALDTLPFLGTPVDIVQALQFPRYGVVDPTGARYATDVYPAAIVRAHAHLTVYLSSLEEGAEPFNVDETSKFSSMTVGPVSMDFRPSTGPDGGTFLATVIAPMLRPWKLLGAPGAVRLVR
jgi:hypothetical protein